MIWIVEIFFDWIGYLTKINMELCHNSFADIVNEKGFFSLNLKNPIKITEILRIRCKKKEKKIEHVLKTNDNANCLLDWDKKIVWKKHFIFDENHFQRMDWFEMKILMKFISNLYIKQTFFVCLNCQKISFENIFKLFFWWLEAVKMFLQNCKLIEKFSFVCLYHNFHRI